MANLIYKISSFGVENLHKIRLSKFLSDRQVATINNLLTYGKFLNLSNPQTICEKIQWIKLYDHLEMYTRYVDKYEVRNYVKDKIGKKYLIPLLGVWEKFEDINFDNLPNKFVLKATHGSGYVFVCKDKNLIEFKKLHQKANNWLTENFYKKTREVQYSLCKPRLICEEYMEDKEGQLTDYKFYCFNGKPELIEVHTGRFTDHKIDFVDLNFNRLPIRSPLLAKSDNLTKPINLKEMVEISRALSEDFPFVRVDLYSVQGKTYFGELTFTPANGLLMFQPLEVHYKLGKLIDLTKYDRKHD